MKLYIQLPYPGSLTADLNAKAPEAVIVQNPATLYGGLYSQCAEVVQYVNATGARLFVGSILSPPTDGYPPSVSMPAWAATSPYVGAMTNSDYRWLLLNEAKRVWQLWRDTYGGGFGFYLSHEANLGLWAGYSWSESVRAGYEAVLVQTMRDAAAIQPYTPVIWSPYIWQRYSDDNSGHRGKVKAAYGQTINGAVNWLHDHDLLPLWLSVEMQDGVGAGAARGVTKEDAAGWLNLLNMEYETGVNVELFDGSMQPATDVPAREAYYASQGFREGVNFELRYSLSGL